ncbi:bifunctional 4-hydroxy-2-oxoglutarate aldolase/2-dehydro-3-deoxy-phosphogluconate aldolase [Planctomycetota bacterium]
MARFTRLETLTTIMDVGVVPVFYNGDIEVVKQVVKACSEGGSKVIEFTNRGDFAIEVFGEMEKFCRDEFPHLVTGVGSVLDPVSAGMYIARGANFIVGSVLNPDVAKICNRRKIPYSPGCGSASEISYAEELGCEIIKIFPGGQVGGPAFVKAVKGPTPWTSIMPTGGVDVTEESLRAWFEAGVSCVGIGSKLIRKDLVQKKDWDGIRDNMKNTVELIKKIRKEL